MKRATITRRLVVLDLGMLIFALTAAPNVVYTAAGKVKEFPIPTANSRPAFITVGPDGNLWFTKYTLAAILTMRYTTNMEHTV